MQKATWWCLTIGSKIGTIIVLRSRSEKKSEGLHLQRALEIFNRILHF